MAEPWNLGTGWVGFDWAAAFGVPVKVMNDAAMQALGSDEGGRMLFLGLGSGLGTALVDDGQVVALELAHLPFKRPDLRGPARPARLEVARRSASGVPSSSKARSCCARRSRLNMSSWAAATSACSNRSPTDFAAATMRRRSRAAFAPGNRSHSARAADSSLSALSAHAPRQHLRELFQADPARAERFSLNVGEHLFIDYSKNLITDRCRGRARGSGAQDRRRDAARSDVRRRADQQHRASRGAARRAAQPVQPPDADRRPRRDAGCPRRARSHANLLGSRPERPMGRPHRPADHRRRQHRHRRIGPRPGHGDRRRFRRTRKRARACTSCPTSTPRTSPTPCDRSSPRPRSSRLRRRRSPRRRP